MNEEQIQQLTDKITAAVATQVRATVNGKIDKIQADVNSLRDDLQPVYDAFQGWKHFRAQAIFWIGGVLALGGAIQAVQAIWSLISPHVKS